MARVLWVSNETPDVDGQGGQRRQYFQVRALVEAGHDVVVGSLAGPQDDASLRQVTQVERLPSPWHRWARGGVGRSRPTEVTAFLSRPTDRVVVAHTESWWTFRHLLDRVEAPVLVDVHNVLSVWHAGAGRSREARRWARVERDAIAHADRVAVCSERERSLLAHDDALLLPHGIDAAAWQAPPRPAPEPVVKLFGSWDWAPNRAGLDWFLTEVWPRLATRARCEVAGPGAGEITTPGVRAAGRVPDLAGFLADAWAVAVPVLHGVGAPVKYAEALASGAPVVATPDGAPARRDLAGLVSGDADAWVAWLDDALARPERARTAGAQARSAALRELTWEAACAPLLAWVGTGDRTGNEVPGAR